MEQIQIKMIFHTKLLTIIEVRASNDAWVLHLVKVNVVHVEWYYQRLLNLGNQYIQWNKTFFFFFFLVQVSRTFGQTFRKIIAFVLKSFKYLYMEKLKDHWKYDKPTICRLFWFTVNHTGFKQMTFWKFQKILNKAKFNLTPMDFHLKYPLLDK